MTDRALTAEQVAAEFGRSKGWLYDNWQRLVAAGKLPPPLMEAGHLVWSKAQLWAYLDKPLPPKMYALVAAHRACLDAAPAAMAKRVTGDAIERDRGRLDHRFANQSPEGA
jgi:hypothetical protein